MVSNLKIPRCFAVFALAGKLQAVSEADWKKAVIDIPKRHQQIGTWMNR